MELKDAVRSAVTEVFKQGREHLKWNQDTLTGFGYRDGYAGRGRRGSLRHGI